jgi:4-hydroxy-tetrahydrodipicolinate synthase
MTKQHPTFEGSFVAIVTPFTPDGKSVDYKALDELVEFQIKGGTDGIVAVGTTGESPTLSHEEHRQVIEAIVKKVNKRILVIAGTGSNSTDEAIELTSHAKSIGADGALVVVPYYNKPTQEGMFLHFSAVADVGLPVILYNVPGRTGAGLAPKTIARLAEHPNVVAIKEASGSSDQVSEILLQTKLTVLSGDDSLTLPFMSIGAKGVISVIGNFVPRKLKDLVEAALKEDYATARKVHLELFKLSRVMFVESNPIPVKTAMEMLGLCNSFMRLPLCSIADANKELVRQTLVETGLLKQ